MRKTTGALAASVTMKQNWYAKTIEDVYQSLETTELGLTTAEAKNRIERYGKNILPEKKPDSLFLIFIRQFASPLIYILLVAGVIIFFTENRADAWIIIFILLFDATVGTIQEGRAQQTLRALKQFAQSQATVLRDGTEVRLANSEVVPGDILIIREGEKIASDARVIDSNSLMVEEASLTGESQPVIKIAEPIFTDHRASTIPLLTGDQRNMVFKGTHAVSGNGQAVVVTTGAATIIGQISQEIITDNSEMPLKSNIRHLSRIIIYVTLGISAALVVLGLISGQSLTTMLATVVTLSVSVIPEGLPVVMTLVLANGVWRMSKRNALVKKLQAVEALGQARVIAVDKTGTITKNELVVQKVFIHGRIFELSGTGYDPHGEVMEHNKIVSPLEIPELILAGRIAAVSGSARIVWNEQKSVWEIAGDPTEAALLVFAEKIGFKKDELLRKHPLVQDIPFDYTKQYHASVHKDESENLLTVVGSPEAVFKLSSFPHGVPGELKATVEQFSAAGLRVLAFAFKEIDTGATIEADNIPSLTFAGLYAMGDVLHVEAKNAVSDIHSAGIKTVMITGDYPVTAMAIAKQAGIFSNGDTVLTGYQIETMSDQELSKKIQATTVFARVTPEHKLRIVRAFHASGLTIAMTGDGVNDAPSLVAADLGIAMGKNGTEVAKEAADIVLLDDNMSTIVAAVEEGRNIYVTIQRVMLYLFSTNMGEVATIAGALLLGFAVPVLPVQILWLNFVTDGFLDVALAMEPKQPGLLSGTFPHPNKYLITKTMLLRMLIMAAVMMVGTLLLFHAYQLHNPEKALTMSLTTLAVFQWFNAWNSRSERRSIFSMNPFSNPFLVLATLVVVGLQLLALYNSFFQKLLHTRPLTGQDWQLVIIVAASIIAVEEIRKLVTRLRVPKTHHNNS